MNILFVIMLVVIGFGAIGMSLYGRQIRDAAFYSSVALPNGAATVYSADFDLANLVANGGKNVNNVDIEVEIVVPDLTTGELADAATLTIDVVAGASASPTANTSPRMVMVHTGAGGAGATGATYTMKVPPGTAQYLRVKAVNSGAGNQSGKNLGVSILF